MDATNPFKQIEPDAVCPAHLKGEILSEIDMIRNTLTVVSLYVGSLFGVVLTLATPPAPEPLNPDL